MTRADDADAGADTDATLRFVGELTTSRGCGAIAGNRGRSGDVARVTSSSGIITTVVSGSRHDDDTTEDALSSSKTVVVASRSELVRVASTSSSRSPLSASERSFVRLSCQEPSRSDKTSSPSLAAAAARSCLFCDDASPPCDVVRELALDFLPNDENKDPVLDFLWNEEVREDTRELLLDLRDDGRLRESLGLALVDGDGCVARRRKCAWCSAVLTDPLRRRAVVSLLLSFDVRRVDCFDFLLFDVLAVGLSLSFSTFAVAAESRWLMSIAATFVKLCLRAVDEGEIVTVFSFPAPSVRRRINDWTRVCSVRCVCCGAFGVFDANAAAPSEMSATSASASTDPFIEVVLLFLASGFERSCKLIPDRFLAPPRPLSAMIWNTPSSSTELACTTSRAVRSNASTFTTVVLLLKSA
eukprot:PhM_4_TR10471/c0_g1_i1/m.2019